MEEMKDLAPRRKPSQKKPPKKAKHKHHYEPCIYRVIVKHGWLDPEHGFRPAVRRVPGTYCHICGKVGDIQYFWDLFDPKEPHELPTDVPEFELADAIRQKSVNLEEAQVE